MSDAGRTARLRGLHCPVTTPFDHDDVPDAARLAEQIRIYLDRGVDGAVLFGTSGEGPLLDEDEMPPLVEAARAALGPDRPAIAQVGRESLRATVRLARRVEAAGADALLCLPPRYYPVGEDGIGRWYHEIRAAVDLPLLAYHIPQRSHVELTADLLAVLGEEGAVAGIKESAGDLELQAALRDRLGEGFLILSGKASETAAAVSRGADGAILAVADAAPEAARALVDAARSGPEAAADLQAALLPLAEALGPRFGVPGIKAALDLRGWPGGGAPRAPLVALAADGRRAVAAALREAGVDLP